jgi:hypothetical protein
MQSAAIAFPVGDSAEVKRIADELVQGEQSQEHHNVRKQQGFHRVKVFHQRQPQEMVIVYLEADDIAAAARSISGNETGFEQWLSSRVRGAHGHERGQHGSPPSELVLDWHADHGASRTEHSA